MEYLTPHDSDVTCYCSTSCTGEIIKMVSLYTKVRTYTDEKLTFMKGACHLKG